MRLTNQYGLSLPMAVWLLHDEYDYIDEPNYISATSLLKSTRQIVLSKRVNDEDREVDISSFLASSTGSAVHDSMDKAWRMSGRKALKMLGYPERVWSNIAVNPSQEEIDANPDIIPVWIEQRAFKKITVNGVEYTIGGKFDQVIDGRLFDAKTTSTFAYTAGKKDDDYAKQGAIYRWLNPERITSDHIFIQFIFTDWQKARARNDPNYPQVKALEYPVLMPSIEETENFIRLKLMEIQKFREAPEEDIPHCTDKELWRAETVYKYYADPTKTSGRSTKNFEGDKAAAHAHLASKGGKGVVLAVAGDVRACEYCAAFSICKQKDNYFVA